MNLNNLNCKYLEIKSLTYDTLVSTNKLASVTVKGKINDGTLKEKTIHFPVIQKTYNINFPIDSNKSITEFNVVNFMTGQQYDLLDYAVTINSIAEIAELKNIIASKFNSLFGTTIHQSHVVNYDDNTPFSFRYSISNLPYYIVPVTVSIRQDGIETKHSFEIPSDDNHIAFGKDRMIISPEFFDEDTYTDSIISITVIFRTPNRDTKIEQACYFMDCSIKCKLPSIQNFHCISEGINIVMLHYALTQASNCECDCNNMLSVFNYLQKQVNKLTNNIEDCGCR